MLVKLRAQTTLFTFTQSIQLIILMNVEIVRDQIPVVRCADRSELIQLCEVNN